MILQFIVKKKKKERIHNIKTVAVLSHFGNAMQNTRDRVNYNQKPLRSVETRFTATQHPNKNT